MLLLQCKNEFGVNPPTKKGEEGLGYIYCTEYVYSTVHAITHS